MSATVLEPIGIGCFVLVGILLFVAWDRHKDNASKTEAVNKMMRSSPLGGMMKEMRGAAQLESGIPTATKYSLFFAVLSWIGGVGCMVMAAKKGPGRTPPEIPRTP